MVKFKLEFNFVNNIPFNRKKFLYSFDIIIFFFLLNFLFKKKNYTLTFNKMSFFFKKKKNKFFTYLRAPYRYKLAKNQVSFSRYFFNVKILFSINKKIILPQNTLFFINFFKVNTVFLSTNLSNLTFFKFYLACFDNFLINNNKIVK